MSTAYLSLLLMAVAAIGLAVLLFALTSLLGPKKMTAEKAIPYESGSDTSGARHIRLSVHFYLTAILFVVFDVEIVFIYPWARLFRDLGWYGFFEMMTFVGILAFTLLYIWKKGALEWAR